MKIGISLRNMGPQSTREILSDCARAADQAGLDSLWITDHIAIPPDDAEGSGGRYLDPLITLSYLAGQTDQIRLGTGVLILPYRPALVTAKLVATLQELCGDRLLLGVGIGWLAAEFKAVGRELSRRGRDSDLILAFLKRCFANDEVELNGQPFLFKPRPRQPTILIGGSAPHAIRRALTYGDGWMPMGMPAEKLAPLVADYRQQAAVMGRGVPDIVTYTSLPLEDKNKTRDIVDGYRDAGVTTLVYGQRYQQSSELIRSIGALQQLI